MDYHYITLEYRSEIPLVGPQDEKDPTSFEELLESIGDDATFETFSYGGEPLRVANAMYIGAPLAVPMWNYMPRETDVPDAEQYAEYLNKYVAVNYETAMSRATPAYRQNTEPDVMAQMPIAAHQEMETIGTALEQYANQLEMPNSRILLFCNWPTGANSEAIMETMRVIRKFQVNNLDVPIAYFGHEFPENIPIGAIRKTLWDTALYGIRNSRRTDDILMLNHDADITYLDPYHFKTMHQKFVDMAHAPAMVVYPHSGHEAGGDIVPNMDAVRAWYDFRSQYFYWPYETGAGISARAYAAVAGFETLDRMKDFHNLVDRCFPDEHHYGRAWVDEAEIRFSSRRVWSKLSQGLGTEDIWNEEFTANDSYRTLRADAVADITPERRDELIANMVIGGIHNFFGQLVKDRLRKNDPEQAALAHARRVVHAGRLLLGGCDIRFGDDELVAAHERYTVHDENCACDKDGEA